MAMPSAYKIPVPHQTAKSVYRSRFACPLLTSLSSKLHVQNQYNPEPFQNGVDECCNSFGENCHPKPSRFLETRGTFQIGPYAIMRRLRGRVG